MSAMEIAGLDLLAHSVINHDLDARALQCVG